MVTVKKGVSGLPIVLPRIHEDGSFTDNHGRVTNPQSTLAAEVKERDTRYTYREGWTWQPFIGAVYDLADYCREHMRDEPARELAHLSSGVSLELELSYARGRVSYQTQEVWWTYTDKRRRFVELLNELAELESVTQP